MPPLPAGGDKGVGGGGDGGGEGEAIVEGGGDRHGSDEKTGW
jgi:hypothetical protein